MDSRTWTVVVTWSLWNDPYVVDAFNNDARRLGVEAYGYSENERWNWRYGGFDMQNIWRRLAVSIPTNSSPKSAGRIANTIWYDEMSDGRGYAHWALSGAAMFSRMARPPTARFKTRPEAYSETSLVRYGTNRQWRNLSTWRRGRRLECKSTYRSSVNTWASPCKELAHTSLNFHGGYVYVAYWLTNDYSPWNRQRGVLGRTKPNENFFIVQYRSRSPSGAGEPGRSQDAFLEAISATRESKVVSARVSVLLSTGGGILTPVCNSTTSTVQSADRNTATRVGGGVMPGGNQIATIGTTSGSYNCFGTQFMIDW